MSIFTPETVTPGAVAKSQVNQVVTTAAIFAIDPGATLIRVCAVSKDILVHWSKESNGYCTANNFDDVVAVGTTQDITIPHESADYVSFLSHASGGTVIAVQK